MTMSYISRECNGEVVWGDGSTRRIKFSGKAPGVDNMVNTGGAASTHLVSVGATLNNLHETTNKEFIMGFDRHASYLIRDATFQKGADGEYRLCQQNSSAPVLKTSTRGKGSAGVYEVPLYDAQASEKSAGATRVLSACINEV